jgi:GNAT superfamily N-acetyltransferase
VTAPYRIRQATAADAGVMVRMIREFAEYEKLLDEVKATEELLLDHLFGSRSTAETLIAESSAGEPVGYAVFFQTFSTFEGRIGIYIEDIYVRPRYRALGFGVALSNHIARIAVQRGCGRVEGVVLDWNRDMIAMVEGMGYRPVPGWTLYRLTGDALAAAGAPD